MNDKDVRQITDWLIQKADEVPYGQLTVTVKLHKGRPDLIERTFTERVRTGNTGVVYEHDNS